MGVLPSELIPELEDRPLTGVALICNQMPYPNPLEAASS
jgi:hypothetical protein